MPADEVSDLKSEILFGSSHCSCSSCDSIRCFGKRYSIANDCPCSICKEPTTCLYNLKKEPIGIAINAIPSKESQNKNEKVKPSNKRYTKRNVKRNLYDIKNIINVNVDNKNVMIQTQPQHLDNASVKCKDENIQSQYRDDDATNTLIRLINQFVNNYNSISMQDVVDKITEVCKKCSCKVCECITRSGSNKCDCKPCDCVDCKSVLMQINSGMETKNNKNELTKKLSFNKSVSNKYKKLQAFTYDGDERDDNYRSIRPNGPCECKPCDCDQCKIFNVNINDDGQGHNFHINIKPQRSKTSGRIEKGESKRCICKTYQCGKCRSMFGNSKNVVVAPVEEYPRNNLCACSPCDCNNCRQYRSSVSNNGMRETSTAMFRSNCQCQMCLNQTCRQTVGSCRCESRNNVISKPFVNNKQNIDIHSALVKKKKSKQRCTISVLTDVMLGHRGKNAKVVNDDCRKDKLTCDDKNEPSVSASTSYYHITSLSTVRINDRRTKKCQCDPCECKICEKFKIPDRGVWKSEKFRSKCNCEICSCLYCGDLLQCKDVGDNNRQDELSINICEVNESCNKDRSVFLALLHDVYSKISITKNNRDDIRSDLFVDKPSRLQNARKSSFHSALSISRTHRLERSLTQMPENKLHEPYEKHFRNNYQFKNNTIVATFINKVTKIDEINDLNFYIKDVSPCYRLGKEIPDNYQPIESISEKLDNNLKYTIKESSSNARTENCDEAKKESKTTQNVCKTQKLPSTEGKTQNKCDKLVRECFGKTNLASKNYKEENQETGKQSIFDGNSTHNLLELGSNKLIGGFLDESNGNDIFQTDDSYYQQCNILFKAKLLTCELLKMLFQYQKANKEFESVRQKFKIDPRPHLNSDIHSISQKKDELHDQDNIMNLDFKFSSAKLALQSDTYAADDGNIRKSSKNFLNKEEFLIEHYRNLEKEQSKSNSYLNKDVAKNENVELLSKDLVVNEFTNITRSELQFESQLTTFCSKMESRIMLKSISAKLNKFADNSWGLNKTDESLNLKKIKYVDIDKIDKYEVFNKRRYILIENIAARSEEYNSEISEQFFI